MGASGRIAVPVPPSLESRSSETFDVALGAPTRPPLRLRSRPLRLYPGTLLLAALAAVLAGASVLTLSADRRTATWLALGALAAALVPALVLVRRAVRRPTLTVFEQGVRVETWGTRSGLRFDEIRSLDLFEEEVRKGGAGGALTGLLRRVSLLAADGRRITFEHSVPVGEPDEAGHFLIRLLADLIEAAERRIRAGEPLTGHGWILALDGLRAPAGAPPVRPWQIVAVANRKGRISAWRGVDPLPFLSIPTDSPNAMLLFGILEHRIATRSDLPGRGAAGGMGQLLAEREAGRAAVIVLLAAILLTALGAGAIARSPALALVLLPLSSLTGALALALRGARLLIYEHGLVRESVLGRRVLRFQDLAQLRLHLRRMPLGSTLATLDLESEDGRRLRTRWRRNGREDSPVYRNAARAVADRLASRLDREGEVPWVPGVRLSRRAIHLGTDAIPGWRETRELSFENGIEARVERDVLRIYAEGEERPVVTASMSAPNALPGLLLLERLVAEAMVPRMVR